MVEKQLEMFLVLLRKECIVSEDLTVIGFDSKLLAQPHQNARLLIFSLVLGTKSCLETDDLRVLEISEKCSRLTKYVGCRVERVR